MAGELTMPDREKLIKIMRGATKTHEEQNEQWILGGKVGERPSIYGSFADHFIANGVGFLPKWIPVTERLPEPKELVLCIWKDINGIHYGFARYQHDNVWYVSNEGMPEVTHWMPLPQPPKGE